MGCRKAATPVVGGCGRYHAWRPMAFTLEEALELVDRHRRAGRPDQAERICRQILAQAPHAVSAINELGGVLVEQARHAEAAEAFALAVRLRPELAELHVNLALSLQALGRDAEARRHFETALRLNPDIPAALNNLGNLYKAAGELDQAISCYRRALTLAPDWHGTWNNLGTTLQKRKRLEEAASCFQRAMEIAPADPDAYVNLGNLCYEDVQLQAAIDWYRKAVERNPGHGGVLSSLAGMLGAQGRLEEAIGCLRRAVELAPASAEIHGSLLMALQYDPVVAPVAICQEHLAWAQRHADPLMPSAIGRRGDRDPDRRLRIGYVSPDFRDHSAAFFIEPLLEHHRRDRVEVFCYSSSRVADMVTRRLRARADHWCDIVDLSDDQAAERIREDRVDILVDLACHTSGNRLGVFARKPAPVQATYLGYPYATGMAAMDYWVTDIHLDPPDAPTPSRERQVRLPEAFVCYRPPDDAPAVADPPCVRNGFVTFGSFNTLTKLNRQVIAAWAQVLRNVAGARLLLKTTALGDAPTARHVAGLFAACGIEPDRLILEGSQPLGQFLSAYGRVDLMLDPWPFNGHTISMHGLWMGVPLVTLYGDRHAARRGGMLLRNLRLEQMIALTPDQYIEIATDLGRDRDRLAELRRGMRRRVAQSPLVDGPRFIVHLEAAYRSMWRAYCGEAS